MRKREQFIDGMDAWGGTRGEGGRSVLTVVPRLGIGVGVGLCFVLCALCVYRSV